MPGGDAPDPAATAEQEAGAQASDQKVAVQVLAEGTDGSNTLTFRMKLSTAFGKMMGAWCEHHGIPRAEVRFIHGERELQADDSPQSCGWRIESSGELVVRALPRASAQAVPAENVPTALPTLASAAPSDGLSPATVSAAH